MHIRFLCENHRNWVIENPELALSKSFESQLKGEQLMMEQNWQDASRYLGCAYESMEILSDIQGFENRAIISRLTNLSLLLAEVLEYLQPNVYAHMLLSQCYSRLMLAKQKLPESHIQQAYINRCLKKVFQHQQGFSSPDNQRLH